MKPTIWMCCLRPWPSCCLSALMAAGLVLAQEKPNVTTVPPMVRNGVTVTVIHAPGKESKESLRGMGAGQKAHVDPQTGKLRDPEHDESARLSEEVRALMSVPLTSLQPVQHASGMVSVDLQDAFQSFATATIGKDGKVVLSCDDKPVLPAKGRAVKKTVQEGSHVR